MWVGEILLAPGGVHSIILTEMIGLGREQNLLPASFGQARQGCSLVKESA